MGYRFISIVVILAMACVQPTEAGEVLALEKVPHRHIVFGNNIDFVTQIKFDAWTSKESLKSAISIETDITELDKRVGGILVAAIGKNNLSFVKYDTNFDLVFSRARIVPTPTGAEITFRGSLNARRTADGVVTKVLEIFVGEGTHKLINEELDFRVPVRLDLSARDRIGVKFDAIKVKLLGETKRLSDLWNRIPSTDNVEDFVNTYVNSRKPKDTAFPFPPQFMQYSLAIDGVRLVRRGKQLFAETKGEMQVPGIIISAWARSAIESYMMGQNTAKVRVTIPPNPATASR